MKTMMMTMMMTMVMITTGIIDSLGQKNKDQLRGPTFCSSDFGNHSDKVLSIRFQKMIQTKKIPLFSYFLVADRNLPFEALPIHLRLEIIQSQIVDDSNSPRRKSNVVKSVKT